MKRCTTELRKKLFEQDPPPYEEDSLTLKLLSKMNNLESMVTDIHENVLENNLRNATSVADLELKELYISMERKKIEARTLSLRKRELNRRKKLTDVFPEIIVDDSEEASIIEPNTDCETYDRVFNKLKGMISHANNVLSSEDGNIISRQQSFDTLVNIDLKSEPTYHKFPKDRVDSFSCEISTKFKFVKKDRDNFLPVFGRLIYWMFNFIFSAAILDSDMCTRASYNIYVLLDTNFNTGKHKTKCIKRRNSV